MMYEVKDIRTCSENKKLSQLAEFKGQLIDIFEEFLDSKGVIIHNPERDEDEDLDPEESANIYGSDYDELSDRLMETIENWGLLKPEITVDTLAGQLVAYAGKDLDNPSVGICYRPQSGGEIDLAMAETQGEDLRKNTNVGKKDVVLYKWEDPFSEDYTSKSVFHEKDIERALE